MPQFSVIIPTYNRHFSVEKAIQSVLAQTFTDFELILIDDGSTDSTSKLAETYKNCLTFISQPNRGVSAARNQGIIAASSPYLAFLDSDDCWFPTKLEAHHDFLKQNRQILIHQTLERWYRNGKRINPRQKHQKKAGNIFYPSLELCLISPSAVVLHRDLFVKYGLFDERLRACEDYDLWLRITPSEEVGLIEKEHMIRYAGHDDQLSGLYWGMDRFRVYSLIKLLIETGTRLTPAQIEAAKKTALKKAEILKVGALKREKKQFADYLVKIIHHLQNEDYSSIDYQNLAQEDYS